MKYYVQIKDYDGDVVMQFGPYDNLRRAERVERGVSINLNHDKYENCIVTEDDLDDDLTE